MASPTILEWRGSAWYLLLTEKQRTIQGEERMEERHGRLHWVGNKSKDDGKVEDVPVRCLLEEDRRMSLRAGCTVRVHRARAWVWREVTWR